MGKNRLSMRIWLDDSDAQTQPRMKAEPKKWKNQESRIKQKREKMKKIYSQDKMGILKINL